MSSSNKPKKDVKGQQRRFPLILFMITILSLLIGCNNIGLYISPIDLQIDGKTVTGYITTIEIRGDNTSVAGDNLSCEPFTVKNNLYSDSPAITLKLSGFSEELSPHEFVLKITDEDGSRIHTGSTYTIPKRSSTTFEIIYQIGDGTAATTVPTISFSSTGFGVDDWCR